MKFQHLTYKIENQIAVLTIDRPPVNALNRELVAELSQAAEQIQNDADAGEVRSVIITANGKCFCAGADLKERMGMPEEQVAPTVKSIGDSMKKIAGISVPTIAALQGSAFGGGFEVALAADIRVVVDSAQLGLRETALAIIPGAGGTQRLTRLVGPSNAVLWITSARLFTAEEALAQGAVNFVVTGSELMLTALEVAAEISKNGPLAVQQAKRAIYSGLDKSVSEGLKFEFECYKKIIPTNDRIEGLAAFKEKREPKYEGK
ncbi:MAG: enoyl-CoA hydratase [Caldithrix sp.]|nr:MAG: enoyl-CoA hydratase [Caldithrix sp.]